METSQSSGMGLLRTMSAVVVSLVVFAIVSTLFSVLYSLFLVRWTIFDSVAANIMASIGSVVVGIVAAKAACNAWLRGYSAQSVFIVFAILGVLAAFSQLVLQQLAWEKLPHYLVTITILVTSYILFWKNEETY
jgi:hypothetical protein